MPPKRPAKVIPPPSESESEDETSSEEEAPTQKAASSAIVDKKPASNKYESSSQSGSEDEPETESESDEENVEPMASKPVQEGTGKGKKQEKLKSIPVSPPAKNAASMGVKSGGKRVASEDGMDYKKSAKKRKGGEGGALEDEPMKTASDSKKLFQRVWNEDDEIALLKGMVDFSSEKGADPCADIVAFHEFIKKLLHFDVSKVQLSDKIRRLKKKYENNSGRSKNGKNPTFSKLHEERAFELSKKVWGGGGVSEKVVAHKEEAGKKLESSKVQLSPPPVLSSGLSLCITALTRFQQGLDEQVVRRGVELIEPSKRAELEERWMVVQKNEIELAAKKAEITMETARAIWEAYDVSSSN